MIEVKCEWLGPAYYAPIPEKEGVWYIRHLGDTSVTASGNASLLGATDVIFVADVKGLMALVSQVRLELLFSANKAVLQQMTMRIADLMFPDKGYKFLSPEELHAVESEAKELLALAHQQVYTGNEE